MIELSLDNKALSPMPGELLEHLRVTDLTVDGKAVARWRGRVVFLDQGLPGALVNARLVSAKKKLLLAEVENELEPSPDRVEPWCPHFTECGACLWQHYSLAASLDWKRGHVGGTLARIGGLRDIDVRPVLPSPLEKGMRNKMSYAFAPSPDGTSQLGLRRSKDHSVVEVRHCGLQTPLVMEMLEYVRHAARRLGLRPWGRAAPQAGSRRQREGYLRFLIVRTPAYMPDGRPQMLVECVTGPEHDSPTGKEEARSNAGALRILGQELCDRYCLSGFVHSERRDPTDLAQGEKVIRTLGRDAVMERFGHIVLKVPHAAFLQTNSGAAELLYDRIAGEADLKPGQVLWDLYSGIGSIGLFLARSAGQVYGIEAQGAAVQAAVDNAAALGCGHCNFLQGDISPASARGLPAPDVIVVDPPRAGLSGEARELLLRTPARRLLYVSCDPATQARDAALLGSRWQALRCWPVDMFPYTPHVENLLVFERRTP